MLSNVTAKTGSKLLSLGYSHYSGHWPGRGDGKRRTHVTCVQCTLHACIVQRQVSVVGVASIEIASQSLILIIICGRRFTPCDRLAYILNMMITGVVMFLAFCDFY